MANIKKNFNFRNGVQVDDDNLLVTDTGLVGIGTTIPTESLDVRGNVVVTGFTSTTTAQIGVLTVTTFVPNQITGAGLSVFSGIVTAQGAGILTYFGDARNLQGMPTSQWEDKDVGLGFTSIYNTGGNVGVGTEDPRTTFQVGNNVDAGEKGVGISSVGNINMTGILTATSLIGNLTGDVTGRITGDLVGNINSAGVSTAVTLDVNGDLSVAGVSTFTGALDANGDVDLGSTPSNTITFHGDVDSAIIPASDNLHSLGANGERWSTLFVNQNTSNLLNVSGVSTFTGAIDANGGATVDNIQIGVTGDNEIDTSSGNITIDSAGGTTTIDDILSVTGSSTFSDDIGIVGLTTTKTLLVTGITTLTGNVDASYVGASSTVFATKLGVGTTEAPVNDIQVRKSGDVEVQITSETGTAGLTIGRETGNSDTNNSEIRYGKVSAGAPYSSAQSLDILNYGTGNFNYHISANNPGAAVGDYHWHKGINSGKLMTLTNTGRLGIGETQPNETLTVSGVCTISANSFVGGNFFVVGNSTIGGDVTIGGNLIIPSINTNITGNLTGSVFGNVNIFSGISTFKKVGVNTTICFDSLDFDGINAIGAFKRLGIGQTQPDGILDVSGEDSNPVKKFILLPQVSAGSTSVVQAETPGVGGGLIYNTTLRKLQFYNGTNWETVTSVEVTG